MTLILACSLHYDDSLVRALIRVQSQDNPYFVGNLSTLATSDMLTSAEAAVVEVDAIKRKGERAAIGLLGIPVEWAARFNREPRDLFDACTNVAVGTAMLSEFEADCPRRKASKSQRRSNPARGSRSCVLRKFAESLGLKGAPAAILSRLTPFEPMANDPISSAPVFSPGSDPLEPVESAQ